MMKKNNKHKIRNAMEKISSIVVSFILFIMLVLLTFLVATYIGLIKKSALLHNIYTTDYSEKVQEYLYEKCYDYTLPSNVPLEVIDDIFPMMKVKYDINNYAKAAIDGETYKIDTDMIEDAIRKNINIYIKRENIKLDDEQKANLEEYIEGINTTYISTVKVPFIDYFIQFRAKIEKIIYAGIAGICLIILICLVILYKLQRWMHRFIRYILYSILSTILVIMSIPSIILIKNIHEKIRIKPLYFYSLLVSTIEELLKTYIYMGIFWSVAAVCMFILLGRLKENPTRLRKKKSKNKISEDIEEINTVTN